MGALSLLLPLSISSLLKPHQSLPKTHFSNPIFSSKLSSIKLSHTHFSHESVLRSSKNDTSESRFLDDNGVVDDMDGYLNYLSLEYDSVWDTKPSWQDFSSLLSCSLLGFLLLVLCFLTTSDVFYGNLIEMLCFIIGQMLCSIMGLTQNQNQKILL